MMRICYGLAVLLISTILFSSPVLAEPIKPSVHLSNVKVMFISAREIRISGDVRFNNLFSQTICDNGWHVFSEGTITFEYTTGNGVFNNVWLDAECSYNQYHYTDGRWRNSYMPPPGSGPDYYRWEVTDSNRGSWLLDAPNYEFYDRASGRCQDKTDNGDNGKVFSFDRQFTLPSSWAAPSSQYRVFVTLEWMLSNGRRYACTSYYRDFYGPFPVPGSASRAANQTTGRAVLNIQAKTLHIPLLDFSNLVGSHGDTWWLDLGFDVVDSALVLVLDPANAIGGIGRNASYNAAALFQAATFDPSTSILHIPELDIGDGNSYWLDLHLLPGLAVPTFAINSYGMNSVDYSGAFGNPCGSDREFLRSLYQSVLDRDLEISLEGADHLQSLQKGATREALTFVFFHSREYLNRQKNDREFIRDAYQAVLGREPLLVEQAVNLETSRDEFIASLFISPEYQDLTAGCR